MKTTKLTLFVLLLAATAFSQTGVFRLGFTGMYPEGNTYQASQYVQYGWYDQLSLNTWQGFGIGDNHAEANEGRIFKNKKPLRTLRRGFLF